MSWKHPSNTLSDQQLFRDEIVYSGSMVWIGTFNCHCSHNMFGGVHCFPGHHLIVFPRTTVKLTMQGKGAILGSLNSVIFYNHNTIYKRQQINDEWDLCDYFQFSHALLFEILSIYDPKALNRISKPFPFTHTYLTRLNYLRQRQLIQAIFKTSKSNKLQIDETAIFLLESLLHDSFTARGIKPIAKKKTSKAHRQIAFDVQALLATRFDEQLSLKQIADELFVSPYHLSRVFRQQTGWTIHHFLEQIRLRHAYERLGDYKNNLIQLALEVGYSTHSHFSNAFHRNFGFAPSTKYSQTSFEG
ncbi:MAG: AraC family transcriptional regulator [Chloroflexota bacterium]